MENLLPNLLPDESTSPASFSAIQKISEPVNRFGYSAAASRGIEPLFSP